MITPILKQLLRIAAVCVALGFLSAYVLFASGRLALHPAEAAVLAIEPRAADPATPAMLPSSKSFSGTIVTVKSGTLTPQKSTLGIAPEAPQASAPRTVDLVEPIAMEYASAPDVALAVRMAVAEPSRIGSESNAIENLPELFPAGGNEPLPAGNSFQQAISNSPLALSGGFFVNALRNVSVQVASCTAVSTPSVTSSTVVQRISRSLTYPSPATPVFQALDKPLEVPAGLEAANGPRGLQADEFSLGPSPKLQIEPGSLTLDPVD